MSTFSDIIAFERRLMMNYSQQANHSRTNNKRKKRKKRKNTFLTFIVRVLIVLVIIGGFAISGAFLGAYMGIIETAPILNANDVVPEAYTSIIYDKDGNEIDRLHGDENRVYVRLESIPANLQHAVVAIEDERFYDHNGIDIKGMFRALAVNIKEMNLSQGASTITQQLIKNEVLSSEKKIERKIQEQYLAVNFEKDLEQTLGSKLEAKNYILELYLNTIALNHGLNGVQAAAEFYFGKDVSELTLAECASIAGITKNPGLYSPISNPEENKKRQTLVLNKMKELEYISESEYNEAISEDIYSKLVGKIRTNENSDALHDYFVDSAIVALADQLVEERQITSQQAYNMIYSGGLQIYLTVDTRMQNIMEESFKKDELFIPSATSYNVTYTISVKDLATDKQSHYSRETIVSNDEEIDAFVESVKSEILNESNELVADNISTSKSLQAAMAIMDYRNGEVKAIVGGREKTGDLVFNRATQALRQPGSCFKVLAAYAPAIDLGLVMPGTLIRDEEFTYNGWTPKNWYSSGYRGLCSVREGIKDSLNILAAKTIVMVGVDTSYDYLENFGFTTLEPGREINGQLFTDKSPAISLGGVTDGVTVLELTAAYSAIANNGVYNKPIFYSKVLDHNGNIIIDNSVPESHRVIKETTAYMLTDMMEDVVSGGGTGGLARFSKVRMNIAGKTGTTSDDKDLVFAGYTPYYCAGIWMGYDTPMRMKYDRSYHLLLWKDVMEQIHEGLENQSFQRPDGIVSMSMCSVSGGSPNAFCSSDYFGNPVSSDLCASDFANSASTCSVHKSVKICTESMCAPGENCPEETIADIVLAVGNDGTVLNNPESGGVNLNSTCTLEHAPETPTNPENPNEVENPGTSEGNINNGETPPSNENNGSEPGNSGGTENENSGNNSSDEPSIFDPIFPEDSGLPGLTGIPAPE